jgi:hypothetical protein
MPIPAARLGAFADGHLVAPSGVRLAARFLHIAVTGSDAELAIPLRAWPAQRQDPVPHPPPLWQPRLRSDHLGRLPDPLLARQGRKDPSRARRADAADSGAAAGIDERRVIVCPLGQASVGSCGFHRRGGHDAPAPRAEYRGAFGDLEHWQAHFRFVKRNGAAREAERICNFGSDGGITTGQGYRRFRVIDEMGELRAALLRYGGEPDNLFCNTLAVLS